jgi:hypothetical protein
MCRYATPGQQLRYHMAQRPALEPVPAGKPLLLVWCDLLVACLRLCPTGSNGVVWWCGVYGALLATESNMCLTTLLHIIIGDWILARKASF